MDFKQDNLDFIDENYFTLFNILDSKFTEINGFDFYTVLFPNNEFEGVLNNDFSKPNAIYLYRDELDIGTKRRLRRRIMLSDTWEKDYMEYIEQNELTLCSGLSYRGRVNRLEDAHKAHALIFDLDCVGENELQNLLLRIGKEVSIRTLPQPTFIVLSGTGLHLYYVFKDPIDLYPNIKLQLKQLKYDLTYRIWDYKGTTQEKQIQYQSINQSYRMVGSINDKYNLEIKAFRTGDLVDIEYLNKYVIDKKNMVDLNKPFSPTKYTLPEAKEKFPEWYQRVIVEKNKNAKKWHIKRDLYDWWIRQSDKVKGGHRYYFLMCMVIYAVKCDIPKIELKKDMEKIFYKLKDIEHSNPLTKDDMYSALEVYDRGYYNFTIDDIVKLTDISIQKNKRNYRNQKEHLKGARALQEIYFPSWREGNGRKSKEQLVNDYIKENPEANPTQVAKALGISRTTVYKYLS